MATGNTPAGLRHRTCFVEWFRGGGVGGKVSQLYFN